MKFTVTISDFGAQSLEVRRVRNLTLAQAWRVCERAARRGVKLHGGAIKRDNWGARGGVFPGAYRATTIQVSR